MQVKQAEDHCCCVVLTATRQVTQAETEGMIIASTKWILGSQVKISAPVLPPIPSAVPSTPYAYLFSAFPSPNDTFLFQ